MFKTIYFLSLIVMTARNVCIIPCLMRQPNPQMILEQGVMSRAYEAYLSDHI